jgi:hypothetical protein
VAKAPRWTTPAGKYLQLTAAREPVVCPSTSLMQDNNAAAARTRAADRGDTATLPQAHRWTETGDTRSPPTLETAGKTAQCDAQCVVFADVICYNARTKKFITKTCSFNYR